MTPVEEFKAQGVLQPGEPGWWQVWGASVQDILPGDIVLEVGTDEDWFYIEDTFEGRYPGLRKGIVVDGKEQTIGLLCPIGIVRRDIHNILSAFAR